MWRERETASGWRGKTGRRDFLRLAGMATGAVLLPVEGKAAPVAPPAFASGDARWQKTWDAALAVLAGNVKTVPHYQEPVLFEGAVYPGIWQECGPHEGLVYGTLAPY